MICPRCQTDNRSDAKFCDECGFDLRSLAEAASSASPASAFEPQSDPQDELRGEPQVEPQVEPQDESRTEPEDASFSAASPDVVIAEALDEVKTLRAVVQPVIKVPSIELDEAGEADAPVKVAEVEDEIEVERGDGVSATDAEETSVILSGVDEADASVGAGAAHPPVPAVPLVAQADADTVFAEARAMFGPKELSAEVTADLTGLERLVDSSYVPPAPSSRAGDTMEMPRIDDAAVVRSTSFRAEVDRKEARRQRKAQRKLEREQAKRERELQKQGAVPVSAAAPVAEPDAPVAAPSKPDAALDDNASAGNSADKPRVKKGVIAAVVVVVAAVVAVAVAGGTYAMELWGGKVVPDVVGASQADARYMLEEKGFAVSVEQVKSDEAEGLVLGTDPGAGQRAEEGSSIALQVATGRIVPEVEGKTQDAVEALMATEGFANVEYELVKSNEPEGTALAVSPEPGTRALSSEPVTVQIAQSYTVPEVEGRTTDEATALLEGEGYKVTTRWYNTEDIPEGTAVSTEPTVGSKLPTGSEVTLFVAHNRSTELLSLTRSFFTDSPTVTYGDKTYHVDTSTLSVEYAGNNTVNYSVRGVEVGYIFGIAIENPNGAATLTGSIAWNDDNDITSVYPALKQGA
ncbi:MAG: PASTA domain-containing protein [Eggerthellaceae bacterium]|nr:PASTA domain-containing protein [Eggerthellaceae bacterium]